jgi:DNA-directed RNA polymerase subunit L
LCKLRAGEEIEFSASTRLSIALESPVWNVVANCYFTEVEEGKYSFIIEPRSGLDEETIMKRAITIIETKLHNILSVTQEIKKSNSGELRIENDKFTLPGLITFYLQDHEAIEYAGYRCEHLLNNRSVIFYRTKGKRDIMKILKQVCDKIMKDLKSIKPV